MHQLLLADELDAYNSSPQLIEHNQLMQEAWCNHETDLTETDLQSNFPLPVHCRGQAAVTKYRCYISPANFSPRNRGCILLLFSSQQCSYFDENSLCLQQGTTGRSFEGVIECFSDGI